MHGRFFEKFIKAWKVCLVTNKNMQKVQAVPTRVRPLFLFDELLPLINFYVKSFGKADPLTAQTVNKFFKKTTEKSFCLFLELFQNF